MHERLREEHRLNDLSHPTPNPFSFLLPTQLAKLSHLSRDSDEEDGGMERKGLKQEAETVTVQPSQARRATGRSR